jgi:hypothetical protein
MSDTEETQLDPQLEQVEPKKEKKSPAKGIMTEKKLENLAKARAAKKANLDAKKYSKVKRSSAEERIEAEIARRAEEAAGQKALELLEKQKQEAELQEYRQWKKEQAKLAKEQTEALRQKEAQKKTKAKPKKKVVRKVVRIEESEDESEDFSESEDDLPLPPPKKKRPTQRKYADDDNFVSGISFNINDMID